MRKEFNNLDKGDKIIYYNYARLLDLDKSENLEEIKDHMTPKKDNYMDIKNEIKSENIYNTNNDIDFNKTENYEK